MVKKGKHRQIITHPAGHVPPSHANTEQRLIHKYQLTFNGNQLMQGQANKLRKVVADPQSLFSILKLGMVKPRRPKANAILKAAAALVGNDAAKAKAEANAKASAVREIRNNYRPTHVPIGKGATVVVWERVKKRT